MDPSFLQKLSDALSPGSFVSDLSERVVYESDALVHLRSTPGAVVLVLSSTARANYAALVNNPETDPGDLVGLGKESGEIEYSQPTAEGR